MTTSRPEYIDKDGQTLDDVVTRVRTLPYIRVRRVLLGHLIAEETPNGRWVSDDLAALAREASHLAGDVDDAERCGNSHDHGHNERLTEALARATDTPLGARFWLQGDTEPTGDERLYDLHGHRWTPFEVNVPAELRDDTDKDTARMWYRQTRILGQWRMRPRPFRAVVRGWDVVSAHAPLFTAEPGK